MFSSENTFPHTLSAIVVKSSSEQKKVLVNGMTDLHFDWSIGYYALGRDKFSAKTICITFHQKGLTLRACMGDEGSV